MGEKKNKECFPDGESLPNQNNLKRSEPIIRKE